MAPVTLTRRERDVLYDYLANELYSYTDFEIQRLPAEDIERMRDTLRVLDDLGWEPADARESFQVSAPPEAVERAMSSIRRFCDESLQDIRADLSRPRSHWQELSAEDYLQMRNGARRAADEDLEARHVSERVLESIGEAR